MCGLMVVSCIWRRRGSIVPTECCAWRAWGAMKPVRRCSQVMSEGLRGLLILEWRSPSADVGVVVALSASIGM